MQKSSVWQETARVLESDTPDSLHERIIEDAESKALPEAVRLVASGKWKSRRPEPKGIQHVDEQYVQQGTRGMMLVLPFQLYGTLILCSFILFFAVYIITYCV